MRLFGPPQQPRFVTLSPALSDPCSDLHRACFAHGWSSLEFERLIGDRSCFGDAALDLRSGALLGFVLSRAAAGEAEILTIAVAPRCRRHGIGRRLLHLHLARLGAARVEALFLEVSETNAPARSLYAGFGFVEVGRRKAYYSGMAGEPAAAALVLRRDLG